MGFGLFAAEIKAEFGLSSTVIGFVSSLGFFGFLLGLLIAQAMLVRRGPTLPVLWGLSAATAGLALVAAAPSVPVLALGVFVAALSAGSVWTPFNDAVHRKVHGPDRSTALSLISTGTSIGIVAAGGAALAVALADVSWRASWLVFAVMSVLALIGNAFWFRGVGAEHTDQLKGAWRAVLRAPAMPLFAVAFVYGTTSAVYIAFAADHMQGGGGVAGTPVAATSALIFVVYGAFGLFGLLTARIKHTIGRTWLVRGLMLCAAASLVLAALGGGSWAGLIGSAGLQGIHVMMTSALVAMWSEREFPMMPALGFTTALLAMAAGSVLGPGIAGLAADAFGTKVMFLSLAALPVSLALLQRPQEETEAIAPERAETQPV